MRTHINDHYQSGGAETSPLSLDISARKAEETGKRPDLVSAVAVRDGNCIETDDGDDQPARRRFLSLGPLQVFAGWFAADWTAGKRRFSPGEETLKRRGRVGQSVLSRIQPVSSPGCAARVQ